LVPTLSRADQVEKLSCAAAAQGKGQVKAHLKVDTGMGRLGVSLGELSPFLQQARAFPNVHFDGLMSHFASADVTDGSGPLPRGGGRFTREQLARFTEALALVRQQGLDPTWRHLSNSAGVMDVPGAQDGLELNLVRPGILLYGLCPAPWLAERAALRPVLSWKTGITHLKTVAAGAPVSYGGTWVAPRESVIATLPIGYADGYSRAYSNRASVLVRGRRAPIVGRVTMDMCLIDVTDVEGVAVGDDAVLLGEQGSERITAEELAGLSQTIHYEVLCGVGARVPRFTRDS
jgi:alanine racemase